MIRILLFLCVIFAPSLADAATYYISILSGDDTRTTAVAQSSTTPWAHAPQMPSAVVGSPAATYVAQPGDRFIFKGGETWGNANFKWTWSRSGTVSSRIYIGVDSTWFTGASWSRPIFNAGGATIFNGGNLFLRMDGNYVTLDNIEFVGFRSTSGTGFGNNQMINPGTSTGFTIDHAYFHGFFSSADANLLQATAIIGNSGNPTLTREFTVQNSVFSGKDTAEYLADPNCTGACTVNGTFIQYGVAYLRNNYCEYAVNCFIGIGLKVAEYNYFTEIRFPAQPNAHGNMFESLQEEGNNGVTLIHDNVFHTLRTTLQGSNVMFWVGPSVSTTTYVWNNVIANTGFGNVFNMGGGSLPSPCCGAIVAVNNTIECGPDSVPTTPTNVCIDVETGDNSTRIPSSATIKNNFFITSNVAPITGLGPTVTTATNIAKTKAEANAQGYTFAQPYKFSPTDLTDYTVGTGTNLASDCTIMTTLCSDTRYGVVYNETNHTVSLYGRTARPRPNTGNWSVGGYDFGSLPIVAYPLVPGLSLSSTYTMTVNGVNVPVQRYGGNSFAWFSFLDTVNVVVTVNGTVSTYTLSPLRNATPSTKSGATVNFSLSAPKKLVLHKVNAIAEKLFIFGDELETNYPRSSGTGIFNIVTGYGADNTGGVTASTAIQNAINAATAFGAGSVVYVPAGLFSVNASIILKNNVNLYLAPGAVIKNIAGSYTSVTAYHVNNQDNVTISGRGVLYGNGTAISGYNNLMATGTSSGTVDNFQMQDVMLLDSRSTALRLGNTADSSLTNIKILSGSPNLSDGIDTDGVTNLTVDRSFIWSSDDNLAIGSGSSSFSYNVGSPTNGYTIQNSLFYQTSTGHVISLVPVVGVVEQNILFENNDSISVDGALAAYAANGNTADMHHVTFRNIRLEEVRTKPIDLISTDFTVGWGGCPNGFCFAGNGKIHDIQFDRVVFDTFGTTNSQFYGYSATQNIDTVNFNAVYMAGTLVTNAATAHLNIGAFVSNVTYTNNVSAPDVLPPAAPTNVTVQ